MGESVPRPPRVCARAARFRKDGADARLTIASAADLRKNVRVTAILISPFPCPILPLLSRHEKHAGCVRSQVRRDNPRRTEMTLASLEFRRAEHEPKGLGGFRIDRPWWLRAGLQLPTPLSPHFPSVLLGLCRSGRRH